jgi:hypothetical protein
VNPTVTKQTLLNSFPEFAGLDQIFPYNPHTSMLDLLVPELNPQADLYVSDQVYPSTPASGQTYSPIYYAKMLIMAHFIKLTINTEGRVQSDKVGDIATTYAVPVVNDDWAQTIYGQRFLKYRNIYCMGVSYAP